jgi:hypothetical protein
MQSSITCTHANTFCHTKSSPTVAQFAFLSLSIFCATDRHPGPRIFGGLFLNPRNWQNPGVNPTDVSYNASAVKIYNSTCSLVHFGNKYFLQHTLFYQYFLLFSTRGVAIIYCAGVVTHDHM